LVNRRGVLNRVARQFVKGLSGGCKEVEMNWLLAVCLSVGTPLAALGLHDLQTSLERWVQERHAED
jgi:hypothetical protein